MQATEMGSVAGMVDGVHGFVGVDAVVVEFAGDESVSVVRGAPFDVAIIGGADGVGHDLVSLAVDGADPAEGGGLAAGFSTKDGKKASSRTRTEISQLTRLGYRKVSPNGAR